MALPFASAHKSHCDPADLIPLCYYSNFTLMSRNQFACSFPLPFRGRTPGQMTGFLFPLEGIKPSSYHYYSFTTGVGKMLFCSLLTCTSRWAWGNALGAALGRCEEPGAAECSVAVSHRMGCRSLLGYTVCRREGRKMSNAGCRFRDILMFLIYESSRDRLGRYFKTRTTSK